MLGAVRQKRTNHQPPVSIIVAAKNEASNIPNLLEHILNQNYKNYEVILINDRSTDDTAALLTAYGSAKLKVVTIKKSADSLSGKKQALIQGIEAATHNILLFTDADCAPGPNWIPEMVSHLTEEKQIVIGLSPYRRTDTFLNGFIQYETAWTAQQMVGWGLLGIPYMGLGRNILYRKSLFKNNNGFDSHLHITSGDDDLFVQESANKQNTAFCLSPNSQVPSRPEETLSSYFRQKLRHLSTGASYKTGHKLLLGSHALFGFLYYMSLAYTFSFNWKVALLFFIIRLLAKHVSLQSARRKYYLASLPKSAFLFDLCYFSYLSTLGTIAPFIKKWQWR